MAQDSEPPRQAIDRLVRQITVRPTDFDHFRGDVDQEEGRLFGGLVLAQAMVAAGRTVDRVDVHSFHSYFLRGGQPVEPIDYSIERIREGRNFLTRRVTAIQGGHTIFEASVSFVGKEEGISHQEPMPEAPDPETQPPWWSTFVMPDMPGHPEGSVMPERMRRRMGNPLDLRSAGPQSKEGEGLPHRAVWGRPVSPLPEDPVIHAAVMLYLSDSGLVATVGNHYGLWHPGGASASLDHAMWFHYPPRFDDWVLYTSDSPAAHSARALVFAGMYNRDGARIASVAQEALFRRPAPRAG
jgi:acyl-CoA thioesterase-2